MVSVKIHGILFYLRIHTNMFRVCWKLKANVRTSCWDSSQKKYSKTQKATLKVLAQGELKFPILMD